MTGRVTPDPEAVLDLLKSHFDVPADTGVDTRFDNLDLDSLVLIELSVILAKRYGVEVAGEELAAAGTPAGAAELLSGKGATG
ncbi:acyl carrier protein [Streptomyces sp. NPDC006997]|uniref:acyl carrier protein n=1 Tax=Streptomyces sp. NPDC006997 TaxID=3155356 RepID=UPI0033D1A114